MRHDSGVQQRLPRSSHPVTIDGLRLKLLDVGTIACSRTRLPACSSSTTGNAQWWPVAQPEAPLAPWLVTTCGRTHSYPPARSPTGG
jgi:hypothetical protein